jgi:hypothetical protein
MPAAIWQWSAGRLDLSPRLELRWRQDAWSDRPGPYCERRPSHSEYRGVHRSCVSSFRSGQGRGLRRRKCRPIQRPPDGARPDFGDDWDHVIKIERIGESDPQARDPQLQGRCPPEEWAGRRATLSSSPPSPTRRTKTTTTCSLGVAAPSTPRLLTSSTLRTNSTASRADGLHARASTRPPRPGPDHVRARPSTPAVAPRPRPEGYVGSTVPTASPRSFAVFASATASP